MAIIITRESVLERESARLEAIAQLRAGQVEIWLRTRVNQVRFAASSPMGDYYQRWRQHGDAAARTHLLEVLGSFQRASGNPVVLIVDAKGDVVLSSPAGETGSPPELRAAVADAIRSKAPQFTHLYAHDGPQPAPRIDVVAAFPFTDAAAGALVVRVDAASQLYPLLDLWPLPSRTGTTFLVRREGDMIIGQRGRTPTPLSTPNLLAGRVLRGEAPPGKALQGLDFRGKPAVGVVQPVHGTPWYLVARMDRDEIYADANRSAWAVVAAALLALLAGSASLYWLNSRRQLQAIQASRAREAQDRLRLEQLVAQRTSELAARNESLQRTVEDLEAFSASVSHDLRGPLRTMSGFASLLERVEGERLSPDGRRKLERITASAITMDRMIEDILRCSRAEHVEMSFTTVDLDTLVRALVQELAASWPNADISVGPLPRVHADATMAQQVFINLIGNALKFCSQQVAPRVEIGAIDGPIDGLSGAALYVRDNGVGFDSEQAQHLYLPFHRLSSAGGFPGTGVGLSIVKRLLQRHGGNIIASSQPGRTEFVFSFGAEPRAPASAPDQSG